MRTTSCLDRYRAGEREQVWAELVAFGPAVRQEPLYSEAVAVAQEMMTRARHNVALLFERLQALDYQFISSQPWLIPNAQPQPEWAAIEHAHGPLPLVVHTWFEVVGEIDFIGAHPKLSYYYGMLPDTLQQLVSDPLFVSCLETQEGFEAMIEDAEPGHYPPYHFPLAPDSCHKANTSGGATMVVEIPSLAFDVGLLSDDHNLHFIPYLRTCFAWGGFPGLRDDPQAAAAAKDELEFLTKDLLPI